LIFSLSSAKLLKQPIHAYKHIIMTYISSIARPVLGHYVLVSDGGVRVSDVTRGMTSRGEGEGPI